MKEESLESGGEELVLSLLVSMFGKVEKVSMKMRQGRRCSMHAECCGWWGKAFGFNPTQEGKEEGREGGKEEGREKKERKERKRNKDRELTVEEASF